MTPVVARSYQLLRALPHDHFLRQMFKTANRIAIQKGTPVDHADIRAMRQICHQRHWDICQLYCHTAIRVSVHGSDDKLGWSVIFAVLENIAKVEAQKLQQKKAGA